MNYINIEKVSNGIIVSFEGTRYIYTSINDALDAIKQELNKPNTGPVYGQALTTPTPIKW